MKQIWVPLIVFILFWSCKPEQLVIQEPDNTYMYQTATPVQLNFDTTIVFPGDYIKDVSLIDSLEFPEGLKWKKIDSWNKIQVFKSGSLKQLSTMKVYINGFEYSLLLKKSNKQKVQMVFDSKDKKYQTVQLAGAMNGWNPKVSNFTKKEDQWILDLFLPQGKFQYKLVLDGKWVLDPNNPIQVDNNVGGLNSLLTVGENQQGKLPVLMTTEETNGSVLINNFKEPEKVIAFWNNFQLPEYSIKSINGEQTEILIPANAQNKKRSYIRIWSYNNKGESNDLFIPLEYGKVIKDAEQVKRTDKHSMTMYFLMIDRFMNGNKSNDHPVDNPEILPKANYFGGDIQGIHQKIEDGYFADLGINTIWVSPVTQNPLGAWGLFPEPKTRFSGYHGYWPISNKNVDSRFGTNSEFKELIDYSHKNNMNLLLDYVANHVHKEHPVYQQHPEWATKLYLPDGTLNTERWDEHRLTTWFDVFLPTLDLSKPEVIEAMTDSALTWLKDYKLDGFRHDATKHIPEEFWRVLTQKLKKITADTAMLYQIGETYGNRELIGSYINTGQMDGQFDFNVYDDALSAFGKEDVSFTRLAESLHESLKYYGWHNLMGYISGNQDRPRFVSLAGGDVDWGEDTKKAGWTREIGVGNPSGYKKLMQLHAFNFSIPGIPVIYYGDEIGMPGANDPDNRRMMQFKNLKPEEKEVLETVKRLVHLRKSNLALIYGDYHFIKANETTLAYARKYFEQEAIIVYNKSSESLEMEIEVPNGYKSASYKTHFGHQVNHKENTFIIELKPHSFEILTK